VALEAETEGELTDPKVVGPSDLDPRSGTITPADLAHLVADTAGVANQGGRIGAGRPAAPGTVAGVE
jgi:hypothetical protein